MYRYNDSKSGADFRLISDEAEFDRQFYGKDRKDKLLTIAWNRGQDQKVVIDGIEYVFPSNAMLCLMVNESFYFSQPQDILAWQFNREFYCIVDHDKEVSCVGFLFYGSSERMFITLNDDDQRKIDLLLQVFYDEFTTTDVVQGEMLMVLLKRLIIIVTRLAKQQYISKDDLPDDKLDVIRKFNLLVESHYRTQHQVKYYADQLFKSPKTISNLFALYNHKSPLTVIQERIIIEAKRLLTYTDKSAKEIAGELGFEDAAHFSRFFKKHTTLSPISFRETSFVGK
ncbi:helix-turn-helix domain-containing protein [Flavobacterium rakeshii]|uniref:Helix-turn-helix domain-containing protein n=1 Tax=Flavobacterium rakeshii TaxID=1038845 RepID=A0A6N8HFG5_9FLAO|nr:helix-turn-helix domain-containing protein [Flavobacterium rakeshii]MEE1898271.1 helix-turn-helix domain-containing protein [Flavobacterium rakeshii]MUV04465.1 helix-turn-helix domain-containing protein [Flavobacterium rakeshii]